MKFLAFLRGTQADDAAARWRLACEARETVAAAQLRAVINEVTVTEPETAWDLVLELWADSPQVVEALNLRALVPGGGWALVQVDELVEKDMWSGGAPPPQAVKQIAAWWRQPQLKREEARRHWDEHVPLANRVHVGAGRYVRHWLASRPLDGELPYDGVAMQTFASQHDFKERLFDGPQGEAQVRADVQEFIAGFHVLLVREQHIDFSKGEQ
jgi:uncharacterized protein (TIGR02118 family)